MSQSKCPECDDVVTVSDGARMSEIVECGGCRTELEVVACGPVMLALAPQMEEDWGE